MNTHFHSFVHRCMQAAVVSALLLVPFRTLGQDAKMNTSSATGLSTAQMRTMMVTVTAVDAKARTVTLKTEEGGLVTMTVSEEVKRLAEVKAGDKLEIGYLESVGLEFRKPTEEELKTPLKVTEETQRAEAPHAPIGGKSRTLHGVVTLEGASRWLNTLTVKGPRGNYLVVEVQPGMVKWEDLRIGQQMMATYTEAMVMSLEPAPAK